MAELLRGRPAVTVEWQVSLGLELLSAASLTIVVHEFEGLGSWLLEAYSTLSNRLRQDLDLALRLTGYNQAVVEMLANQLLGAGAAAHNSVEAFFDEIAALDDETCRRMLETILEKSIARHEISTDLSAADLLADPKQLDAVLAQMPLPVDAARASRLLRAPTEWRDLVLSSLQRFWERIYRDQWNQTRDQLLRSVEYHRRHSYPAEITALFTAVTGRQVPDRIRSHLAEIERVRFVPSLYLGPYVSFLFHNSTGTILYNGQGTPVTEPTEGPQIEDLYHPLTALADKTRLMIVAMLNGRELYAQEIVDRLGISQSAVSRHLQLMVDMKVLNVRRGERGAKYYSINTIALQSVAHRLSEFR
ncbi:MAG TPA: ArsR family transcriptional regulator [Herpetosiphonaceae bacterium]